MSIGVLFKWILLPDKNEKETKHKAVTSRIWDILILAPPKLKENIYPSRNNVARIKYIMYFFICIICLLVK